MSHTCNFLNPFPQEVTISCSKYDIIDCGKPAYGVNRAKLIVLCTRKMDNIGFGLFAGWCCNLVLDYLEYC
jgi:hypothetical protein